MFFCLLFLSGVAQLDFPPVRPLSQADLYTQQVRFGDGEPRILVGVVEDAAELRLTAENPFRMMFDEDSVPKTLYASNKQVFLFKPLEADSGQVRTWVVVRTVSYKDLQLLPKMEKEAESYGLPVRTFEVGMVVSLGGNVLDTRQQLVGIGGFTVREDAAQWVSRLSIERGERPFLHEELRTPPSGKIGIYSKEGRLLHKAERLVYLGAARNGTLENGESRDLYRDHLYVALNGQGRLALVNSVGSEDLLSGVVPVEIFPNAPKEALKAQAVTARGAIFSKLNHRHFAEPYHLCGTQHCQMYGGAQKELPSTRDAVLATRGLLAVRPHAQDEKLSLVPSVYSAICGGHTEANDVVWGQTPDISLRPRLDVIRNDPILAPFRNGIQEEGLLSWLSSTPPVACASASFSKKELFRWEKRVMVSDLRDQLQAFRIGKLKDAKILGRGASGRVTGVRLIGSEGVYDLVREYPVRQFFSNLKSGLFSWEIERDAAGNPVAFNFKGAGWGHGAGMCQVGAVGLAEQGYSFEQILSHYYNGAIVERIYE